jgi:glycosyltransferase involved in cell wall biosynthesis
MSSVSVAIATYNRAAMVRQAVEAALAQSLRPDEIVVSDDASPDDTLAVLEEIARANREVRVVRQPHNSGGVPNWNHALDSTRGEYLAWCSDDDRFLPDHLEASIAFLKSHPQAGLVHSGFIDLVETEGISERIPRPLRSVEPLWVRRENLIPYLTRYYDWPFHPSTIVMRREVWNRVGPFSARYALADTDWFVRAAEQFPAVLLPRHGVLNRRHPGNWSNRLGSARMQREIFRIVESSIERQKHGAPLLFWKALWRANVRLRLALTLHARLKGGHEEAACAAWSQLARGTGRSLPHALELAGERLTRRFCPLREPRFEDTRQSVSPL